jgi:hypothetical protein
MQSKQLMFNKWILYFLNISKIKIPYKLVQPRSSLESLDAFTISKIFNFVIFIAHFVSHATKREKKDERLNTFFTHFNWNWKKKI